MADYVKARGGLLQACRWNRYVARKGYNPAAGPAVKDNQRALAALRAARRAG